MRSAGYLQALCERCCLTVSEVATKVQTKLQTKFAGRRCHAEGGLTWSVLIERNQTAAAGRAGNLTAQKTMDDICRRHEFLVYTTCLKRSVRSEDDGENKESGASQLRKRDHVPDKGNKV